MAERSRTDTFGDRLELTPRHAIAGLLGLLLLALGCLVLTELYVALLEALVA